MGAGSPCYELNLQAILKDPLEAPRVLDAAYQALLNSGCRQGVKASSWFALSCGDMGLVTAGIVLRSRLSGGFEPGIIKITLRFNKPGSAVGVAGALHTALKTAGVPLELAQPGSH